jgi:deoxyribodipyrimidine photolyase-related protein
MSQPASLFQQLIAAAQPDSSDLHDREWLYIPYDRLTADTGPLKALDPAQAGIVMIEALAKARRRPYHKKKLVLILASQRHFALEQAARGVKVLYHSTDGSFADGLAALDREHRFASLTMMEPAEREMRLDMAEAVRAGVPLRQVEDTTWLSTQADFDRVYGGAGHPGVQKRYLMDRFYRAMRQKTGVLMEPGAGGKPEPLGGRYSFDEENRRPYRGDPPVPTRPGYRPDAITAEVIEMVDRLFPTHFGSTGGFDLPILSTDVEAAWRFALDQLLPVFGPYEDAMATAEPELFHSKLSALINISRLLPGRSVAEVEARARAGRIPLSSAEGFIRQILGWREFMRHVHRVTDGYRNIAAAHEPARAERQAGVRQKAAPGQKANPASAALPEPGARPSALGAAMPLPAAYWGASSGLNCLDTVVGQVIEQGWSHHITRLMVLSNLATLCGYSPRELTDWFWIAYIDAYDWVVEANVLGMGTFADGGVTATKPYVSGAAYINRMSDYCGRCQYDPKKSLGPGSCPFTSLYWTFLDRNSDTLGSNPRMAMPYTTLRRKTPQERAALRARADEAIAALARTSD